MATWLWNWFRSCLGETSKTAKLVRLDGGVEKIKIKIEIESGMRMRMKVAEIMIDNPNQFLCDLGGLKAGHRILAVAAEEEIEAGKTYLLLPFHKLRSVVSEREMAKFKDLKKKKWKAVSSHCKIVPMSEEGVETEKSSLPKLGAKEEEFEICVKMKMGGQRCWKPSLHTIEETRSFKFTPNYATKRQVLAYRFR